MHTTELERVAREIRLRALQAVFEAVAGHIGGEMSVIDILTALSFRVLNVWPDPPK
ncbi:transketolase, partial [Rhizobium leguminosarum]